MISTRSIVAVGREAPEAGAARRPTRTPKGRDDVLGRVEAALVGGAAARRRDRAEQVVEQVERVRREVDEEAAAGDGRIDAPRAARRGPCAMPPIQRDGDGPHVADRAGVDAAP